MEPPEVEKTHKSFAEKSEVLKHSLSGILGHLGREGRHLAPDSAQQLGSSGRVNRPVRIRVIPIRGLTKFRPFRAE